MAANYKYEERRKAPTIHRHIMIKWSVVAADTHKRKSLLDLSDGEKKAIDKRVASMCDVSPDTVFKVRTHDPNLEYIQDFEIARQSDIELAYIQQDRTVSGAIRLTEAVQNDAMYEDEEGNPRIRMQTKRDGTQVPVVPASLIKTAMVDPLDHDPARRFTKQINVANKSTNQGFGGSLLENFKQEALAEGFIPPQIVDAEFAMVSSAEDSGAVHVEIEP